MEKSDQAETFTLDQLRAGDQQAWEKAHQSLYSLAFNVLFNLGYPLAVEDLQEIVQDSIIKLIEHYVERSKDVSELNKLVITIAKNKANDLLARQQATKRGSGKVESIEGQPEGTEYKSNESNPAESFERVERAFLLKEALKKVPQKYRDVLHDNYILGLKHYEIAEKRDLSIGSVGVYINRGLEHLKKILEDEDLL